MQIDTYNTLLTPLKEDVTFRVMIPSNYDQTDISFPVLYVQDGQFLFQAEDSINGDSMEYADYAKKFEKYLPNIIVVGIESPLDNPTRTRLYSPFYKEFNVPEGIFFEKNIRGLGKEYLEWIIYELKPWIDSNYRTRPQAQYTGIAGFSTGALISLYGVLNYPTVFSRLISHSGSFYIWRDCLDEVMEKSSTDHIRYIYMDVSTNEKGRMTNCEQFVSGNLIIGEKLANYGFQEDQLLMTVIEGLDHTPHSFGFRFPDAVRWIFQDLD